MPSRAFLERMRGALVEEVREEAAAVRISSPTFGDVWLARDEAVAEGLRKEREALGRPLPVLTFDEVTHLRGKCPETLRAILEAKRTLSARLLA